MKQLADIRISKAPRDLRDVIWQRKLETYAEHRARQPYAFAVGTPNFQKPGFDAKFTDASGTPRPHSERMFCAFHGDEFCGYIELGPAYPNIQPPEPRVEIMDIWVDPRFRGQGIGGALLDHVKALRAEAGWDNLTATVWAANGASVRLFQAAGFVAQSSDFRFGIDGQVRDWQITPVKAAWYRRNDLREFIMMMIITLLVLALLK
jgi:ribosomal protein S18 acetylase RimI-like enzyme